MNNRHTSAQLVSNVGVVIPVYNRASTLLRTLPFVTGQTLPPRELVIVDDGSTDNTAQAADSWLAEHGSLIQWHVLHSSHVGAAAARNMGLDALGTARYIAFLDSDDHWPADFLERTANLLEQNPDAVAASVDRRYVHSDGSELWEDDLALLAAEPIPWMFLNGAGLASCTLLRREVVQHVGNWPDYLGIAEDFKLFVELAQRGPWLHSPGEPVEFGIGAAAEGEEGNLSRRYELCDWQWVYIYEQIYQELCERNVAVDHGKLQDALATIWNRAGKSLLSRGQRGEAQQCFVKSLRWKPGQWRAWRRLVASTLLPSLSRPVGLPPVYVPPPQTAGSMLPD